MKEVVLKPKGQPMVGLMAEVISPDVFAGKNLSEIKGLPVFEGRLEKKLEDFFEATGESGSTAAETRIVIDGDVDRTKRIAQGMTAGEVIVKGSVGMHLGSRVKGGKT